MLSTGFSVSLLKLTVQPVSALFKFGNILQKYIGTGLPLARIFEAGQAT